jgi:hypothetical protein
MYDYDDWKQSHPVGCPWSLVSCVPGNDSTTPSRARADGLWAVAGGGIGAAEGCRGGLPCAACASSNRMLLQQCYKEGWAVMPRCVEALFRRAL